MLKKLICLASFVLLLGPVAMGVANAADANLVAYWQLDEGTGATVADASGNGNTGTFIGAPQWVAGRIGNALAFSSNGDYVDCGNGPSLNISDAITVALWINRTKSPSNSYGLVSKGGGWTVPGYTFWQRAAALRVELQGPNAKVPTDAAIAPEDAWHHVAFTWDDATDTVSIYIDGALASTGTFAGPIGTNSQNLNIGEYSGPETRYYNGMLDDVQVYNRVLSPQEIMLAMQGIELNPGRASTPDPADATTDVPQAASLSWTPGDFAGTHDVYLGTVLADVTDASRADKKGVLVSQGQAATTYDPPGRLDFGQTYYWRIDEVNAPPSSTIFKGGVWSFTVEPLAYPIAAGRITATASSSNSATEGPENTINGSGLNASGLHGANSTSMWLSSAADTPPAWILYSFDKAYKLNQIRVWNYNAQGLNAMYGLKDVTIEYSLDGAGYTQLGSYELTKASGMAGYASNTSIDFGNVAAQYVRINAGSNWSSGMLNQYGLSEVQFLSIPLSAQGPNPVFGTTDVTVDATLSWQAGREAAKHNVYLSTDEQAVIDGTAPVVTVTSPSYAVSLDLAGTYYWRVDEVNDVETPATWTGDVWSFSTQEYLVVDDFESYNDIAEGQEGSNLIYGTWADGFNNPANGSTIGYDIPYQPTMESLIVHAGKQSVPLLYNNATAPVSEVSLALMSPNWTTHGIRTLSLWFYGSPTNVAGQLYVKINGKKVAYDGDAVNLTRQQWQTWNIDLASVGVNLQNVTSLAIGIEGAGAKGTLLLDDIRLYSYARQLITPVQPDPAGLVAHYPFEGNTNDAAGTNNGTAMGGPTFVAGQLGQAIQFDGIDDYVDCGTAAVLDIRDAITLSCWIKVAAFTKNWEAILGKGDTSYRISRSASTGNSVHFGCNGTTGGNLNGVAIVTDDNWHHVACVYDGVDKIVYIDGREDARVASTGQIALNTNALWIGNNSGSTARQFGGLVDDVRIYSRGLSEAEVAGLAGRTSPQDKPF